MLACVAESKYTRRCALRALDWLSLSLFLEHWCTFIMTRISRAGSPPPSVYIAPLQEEWILSQIPYAHHHLLPMNRHYYLCASKAFARSAPQYVRSIATSKMSSPWRGIKTDDCRRRVSDRIWWSLVVLVHSKRTGGRLWTSTAILWRLVLVTDGVVCTKFSIFSPSLRR